MKRSLAVIAVATLTGCVPQATVRKTAPVADLRPYHSLRLRVDGADGTDTFIASLQDSTVNRIRSRCQFGQVLVGDQDAGHATDLVVDLNIHRMFRGGEGLIKNPNLATVDVLMVLSDTVHDDLVGSAWIRGQSPQVFVSGALPEVQAIDAVAESVATVLHSSGCHGPRVARAEPEPTPVAEPAPVPDASDDPDDDRAHARERAEALNDEGKQLFRSADIEAAADNFRRANETYADPRYLFNLCFAYETLQQYDRATQTCNEVLAMNPDARLIEKTRVRLDSIAQKRGGG